MILGISTFTYGWAIGTEGNRPENAMTEIELIEKCVRAGLTCIQIGDNLPLHTFDVKRMSSLKSLLDRHSIRVEVGAKGLTTENLEHYLAICENLGAPLLRFIIDDGKYTPALTEVFNIIHSVRSRLHGSDITLGIENHDRFKAVELADLMIRVNDEHVGICLDTANSLGAGEGLHYVAETLAPFTVNLHIKDFSIQRLPHKMGFLVQGEKTGKGMTDTTYIFSLLAKYNRCQSAILEQWVPPEVNIKSTIEKEKAWAIEGIEYLKSLSAFKHNKIALPN